MALLADRVDAAASPVVCLGAAILCLVAGVGFLLDDCPAGVIVAVVSGAALAGHALAVMQIRALVAPSLLTWHERHGEDAGPAVVEGRLRDDAAAAPFGTILMLDVDRAGSAAGVAAGVRGGIRLVVGGAPAQSTEWRAGRTVRVTAMLRRPASFANPGVPDEARAQALRGVVLTGSVKSAALVEVLGSGTWIAERAAELRAWIRRTLHRHVGTRDPRSAAVAIAILVGDRSGLSDDDTRRLQEAGTYHVIAISGGNIAILTALLVGGTRLLRLPYRPATAGSIVVLLFYGEVAGGAASVGRAISGATLLLGAMLLDRRGSPLNVLAVAALLALAASPVTPGDGGFLLSFGATAGILLGVPRLVAGVMAAGDGRRRSIQSMVTAVTGIAAATLSAEVALAPVGAALFSRVTAAGLALNFAAIPMMTIVQCGSLLLLAVAELPGPAAGWLAAVVHWSAWSLIESARLVDHAPWLVREVAPPAAWLVGVYYGACIVVLALPRLRRAAAAALAVAAAAMAGGIGSPQTPAPAGPDLLRVVVLDVGQGDATLATLPGGQALLIDAGGLAGTTFDIAGRVILPALRALGVRQLHAFVLTHADPDHIGGAAAVLDRLATANVWDGIPVPPHAARRALVETAARSGTMWRTVRPGDVERSGGVEVRVLHPAEPQWERQRVRNDDSIVLELRHGDVSILLPGDIGMEGESAILERLDPGSTVILKAAHHGSATSTGDALLDAVRPDAVIFSTGRLNRFGHPAAPVVGRLAQRRVPTFNTAEDGAVFIESDGHSVVVRGWRSGRRLAVGGKQR